jgi:hypothetical protein
VLDIKPYLPYVDAIPDANSGYAADTPGKVIELSYSSAAEKVLSQLPPAEARQLRQLIVGILQNDPRPAYLDETKRSRFGMRLYDYNVRWEINGGAFHVIELELINAPSPD